MSWFLFALVAMFGWGFADLFYKKGSAEDDRYSHLKITVWVGLLMGAVAAGLLPFCETAFTAGGFLKSVWIYAPASLGYIVSMVIGYAGLRYLELSIVSPVQNASGALTAAVLIAWYFFSGRIGKIGEVLSPIDLCGTALIVAGVLGLALVEQRLNGAPAAEKKYRLGAKALAFPLLYCLFDTLGTAADGLILDGENGLALGEKDVLVLYGATFFAAGVAAWIFLRIKTKKAYNPFARAEWPKAAAAGCEQFGQIFYVYAMAARPVLAAPMIASYCIVSVVLSRVLLKERLHASQYICVALVSAGVLALGIAEGLA